MTLVRRIARPALASIFVVGGADTLRQPAPQVEGAADLLEPLGRQVESLGLPSDPTTLVRANAGLMVGAGTLLAAGKLPRLSALVLAGTLVPTTLGLHAFWKQPDAAGKAQQATHFFKNLSVLGGLLLAVVDTGGAPSLGWRARRAAKGARKGTGRLSRSARRELSHAAEAVHAAASVVPGVG